MVAGRENMTAASAAYLNPALEPTPYSLRSAPASGRGSCLALGCIMAAQWHKGKAV
jgi:hypothetical protein